MRENAPHIKGRIELTYMRLSAVPDKFSSGSPLSKEDMEAFITEAPDGTYIR